MLSIFSLHLAESIHRFFFSLFYYFHGQVKIWMLFHLSSCVDLFAQPEWLVVGRVFSRLFTHHGVECSISDLVCHVFEHLLFVFSSFSQTV